VLGMLLVGGGLLGAVLLGVVVLPGIHGLATVAEVPLGCDVVPADVVPVAVVEVELVPLLGLVPVAEELVLLDGMPVGVPVTVPLLEGVHGATVVCVPD
jgi:hypothetical protein